LDGIAGNSASAIAAVPNLSYHLEMRAILHRFLSASPAILAGFCPAFLWAGHNALLPQPQKIQYGNSYLRLTSVSIAVSSQMSAEDQFAETELRNGLQRLTGRDLLLTSAQASPRIVLSRTGAIAALPEADEKPGPDSRESYHVRVTSSGAEIQAKSTAGIFYGVKTLLQLVEGSGDQAVIPAVTIDDWPTLAYRGVMVDLSHGPLPTTDEMKKQIDSLAQWKGNQYYFYSELSIELNGYPLINPNGRYSQDQVRNIIAYARERHVDVVPCLEFYGHLHDLFRLERYADLAPLPHGTEINPVKPRMQELLADWLQQMAALFPSPWFHVGLDEPWELERAGSAAAGGVDPEKLYVDHLKRIAGLLHQDGKRMLFWADIASGAALFDRYPKLTSDLPSGVIPVPWHYHAEKDYTPMLAPFKNAHIPELIATGVWGWDTITPDFPLTFTNIDGFLRDGKKMGTLGIINTDWADDAELLFRDTLPGVAYGAIAAWQSDPVDRDRFFQSYCARMYDSKTATEASAAFQALSKAQQSITAALGSEDMLRLWDDPFEPESLERSRKHVDDLRAARLASEDAQQHLYTALKISGDSYSLPSLLLGARLIDYAGMKFLYAIEIADVFGKVNSNSTREDVSFWLGRQASARNHGRMGDLMDTITELRDIYRSMWLAEYTPYRLASAIGRFDAEFEYWRKLQSHVWEVERTYKPGKALPTLDSLRR
jgi:hexosaminidase